MFMSPQYESRNKRFYDEANEESKLNALNGQHSKSVSGVAFEQTKASFQNINQNRGSKLGEMVASDKKQQSSVNKDFFNLNL